MLASPALRAQTLFTGISSFSSDSSGGLTSNVRWNTRGADFIVNIFLVNGANPNGAFINGPGNPQVDISIPLNPGTYTYTMFAGQPENNPYFGLNLFFGGNTTTAGISAFGPVQTNAVPPFPPLTANGNASTYSLIGTTIPGANSLSYLDGNTLITLTSYAWMTPPVNSLDRISALPGDPGHVGSDGILDSVGQFTLEVSLVPEPGTSALVGLAAAGLVCVRRRRNQK
jgi:hypothetical protein